MWYFIWKLLSNERGQEPADGGDAKADNSSSSDTNERATEDDSFGVRQPYDAPNTSDDAHVGSDTAQPASQVPAGDEDTFAQELNLDPATFSQENREIFKRMQAAHTKRMQKFKGYEANLQNMERFYNDRDFAEQTLRSWAQKNGYNIQPTSAFNQNQQATQTQQGTNPLQAKLIEVLKSKLPAETQWMADGQAAATLAVMQEVLGPVLQEFQGFKTAKEQQEWSALESQYDQTEKEFSDSHPGWEVHEEDMNDLLSFLTDTKTYRHPVYGSKHELLFKLVTGNAQALKQATDRISQVPANKTITSSRPARSSSGGLSPADEVAKISDRGDAFNQAARLALAQVKRRR